MTKLTHAELPDASEAEFLAAYKRKTYPKPAVTVDLVVFTVVDADLKVLLVKRKGHPFQGAYALPGGFLDVDKHETLDQAAARELEEETGLTNVYMEQLYTFGGPDRDPRDYVVTVAYLALIAGGTRVQAGDDAAEARFVSMTELPPLAFDHAGILKTAFMRLQGKIDYTSIAFDLVPETFTVADLMGVHQAIKGGLYDAANFRRRYKRMLEDGVLEEAPGRRITGRRPAKVYRFKTGKM